MNVFNKVDFGKLYIELDNISDRYTILGYDRIWPRINWFIDPCTAIPECW